MGEDTEARKAVEKSDGHARSPNQQSLPSAGPHAKGRLTDKAKTPGSGSLPEDDESVIPGSG